MNQDNQNNAKCSSIREFLNLILEGDALTPEENAASKQHLKDCPDCSSWYQQHKSIIAQAKDLPLFDVQEQLTQKILHQLEIDSPGKSTTDINYVAVFILAGAMIFSYWQGCDTISGYGSWLVGILFMFLFKVAVSGIDNEKAKAST